METFAFVMGSKVRTNMDFVGVLKEKTPHFVVLKNPLVMEYSDTYEVLGLAPMYLPTGIADLQKTEATMTIPMEDVAYIVEVPLTDSGYLVKEYMDFFKGQSS